MAELPRLATARGNIHYIRGVAAGDGIHYNVVGIIAAPALLADAARLCPSAICWDMSESRSPHESPTSGVSAQTLGLLAPYESLTLRLIERYNRWGASLPAMRAVYIDLLRRMDDFLKAATPDVVVFAEIPVNAWDFLLYQLCTIRGIATPIVRPTAWHQRLLITPTIESMSGGDSAAPKGTQSLAHEQSDDYRPSRYLSDQVPLERSISHQRVLGRRRLPLALRSSRSLRYLFGTRMPILPDGVPEFDVSLLRRVIMEIDDRRLHRRSLRAYEGVATESLPDQPFVLVALHYQPEASTLGIGGNMDDQLNNVRLLAEAVPADWRVVVREHPATYKFTQSARRWRSEVMYRELKRVPKVMCFSAAANMDNLIRQAELVATVTGTVGWEAVNAGKHVLVFGYPWYLDCPLVHRVTDTHSIRAAIEVGRTATQANDKGLLDGYIRRLHRSTVNFPALEDDVSDEPLAPELYSSYSLAILRVSGISNASGFGDQRSSP